jgi:hypothetical protein
MMCSEIDARTRDNPESAMLHNQAGGADQSPHYQQAQGDPWPWPESADRELQAKREASASSGQLPAPHADAIDRAAYDRFMRGLG